MLRETRQGRNQDPRICCFSRVSEAGILQLSARRHAKSLQSCPCVTLWTAALQPPLCIGFSRQEYWSGLPCPPPGGLPNPGMELPPTWKMDSLPSEQPGKPIYVCVYIYTHTNTIFSIYLYTVNLNYTHFIVVQLLSHVCLFATPWTAAHQASLSLHHPPEFA